jgi:hypothetical protein
MDLVDLTSWVASSPSRAAVHFEIRHRVVHAGMSFDSVQTDVMRRLGIIHLDVDVALHDGVIREHYEIWEPHAGWFAVIAGTDTVGKRISVKVILPSDTAAPVLIVGLTR